MNFPRISVITPTFNSGGLLEETLTSVLGQGYPNLEFIVIDGGSGDQTTEILERYRAQLHYYVSEPDGGQYDAINKGMRHASGEILCWLNADDLLLPKSLFTIGSIFQTFSHVEWVSTLQPASWDANGHLARVDAIPGFARAAFLDGLFLPTTAKKGYWLQQESSFWRRSLWEKIGSQIPNYALAGDFALWCAFYEHADLYGVDYPLAGFRTVRGQRSEDHVRYLGEASKALSGLRKHLNWSHTLASTLCYLPLTHALAHFPRFRALIQKYWGYAGVRIRNTDTKAERAQWQLEHYRFLP
jgi:glycosyltransferase involved in cell wall biosynthesis